MQSEFTWQLLVRPSYLVAKDIEIVELQFMSILNLVPLLYAAPVHLGSAEWYGIFCAFVDINLLESCQVLYSSYLKLGGAGCIHICCHFFVAVEKERWYCTCASALLLDHSILGLQAPVDYITSTRLACDSLL